MFIDFFQFLENNLFDFFTLTEFFECSFNLNVAVLQIFSQSLFFRHHNADQIRLVAVAVDVDVVDVGTSGINTLNSIR